MDLRELGFSMEEIEEQIVAGTSVSALEHVDNLREKLESKIVDLNKKLEQINMYEKWIIDSCLYVKHFKVDTEYNMCCGCEHITPELCRNFYVRDIRIVNLTEDNDIESMEEHRAVLFDQASILNDTCKTCKEKSSISFRKVYRGTWRTNNMEELEAFLKTVYEKADTLGYQLQKIVYCTKRNTRIDGEDGNGFARFNLACPRSQIAIVLEHLKEKFA